MGKHLISEYWELNTEDEYRILKDGACYRKASPSLNDPLTIDDSRLTIIVVRGNCNKDKKKGGLPLLFWFSLELPHFKQKP
jgi:hypothetical protein